MPQTSTSDENRFLVQAKLRLIQRAPWLILCVGLLLTFYFWNHARNLQQLKLTQAFEFQVAKISSGIKNRIHGTEQVLYGVDGLFASNDSVDRKKFHTYVSSLQIEQIHPGLQGIGFARALLPAELNKHISQIRAEGWTDYSIRPAGEREQYSAIVFLEPLDWRNKRALGFDMYSEPVRQAAMARARETGKAAMSGKVKLVQETDKDVQAGVLLYVPIYARQSYELPEPQVTPLAGWAYAPLRMKDMMESLLQRDFNETRSTIGLTIYDGGHIDENKLMFETGTPASAGTPALSSLSQLEIAGQTWTLHAFALPGFIATQDGGHSHQILMTGFTISLLLAILAAVLKHGQQQQRAALDKLAEANRELANSREQLQVIYDTSSIGVFMLDSDGIIRHANRRTSEMFGAPLEKIIGTEYVSHLRPEDQASGRQNIAAQFTGEMRSVDVERCYQRPNGECFWGFLSGRSLIDSDGKTISLVGVIIDTTDRHEADERLRQSEKRYRMLTETMQDVVWTMDVDTCRFTYCSPSVLQLRGYTPEEMIGQPLGAGFDPDTAGVMERTVHQRAAQFASGAEPPHRYYVDEIEQPCRHGGKVWTEVITNYYQDSEGGKIALRGVTRNIDERKQNEEERRIAAVAFETHESTVVTDHEGLVIRANRAFTRLNGYEAKEIIGRSLRLLHSGRHDEAFYSHMWKTISDQGFWQGEVWNRRKDGQISPQWLTITAVINEDGRTTHYVGSSFDISQRVALESEIRNMAFYDALTGLANRRLLTDRLGHAFAKSSRKQNLGAVIYIDLDRFKELNDHLGHAEGDRLLTLVADRLSTNVREGDTVARLGGDEFVILLEDLSETPEQAITQAMAIAEKLRLALNQPYMLQGTMPDDWRCTPSIGIALFSDHRESMEALLKRADRALYAAKHAGRNTIRVDTSDPAAT